MQADLYELDASQVHIANSKPASATEKDPVSKTHTKLTYFTCITVLSAFISVDHMCARCSQMPEEGAVSPRTGVDFCELNVGTGNQIWVLQKSSLWSLPLSHLSSPQLTF